MNGIEEFESLFEKLKSPETGKKCDALFECVGKATHDGRTMAILENRTYFPATGDESPKMAFLGWPGADDLETGKLYRVEIGEVKFREPAKKSHPK